MTAPYLLTLAAVLLAPAIPKERPSIDELARQSDLILRCRLHVNGKAFEYRVVETWKGEYKPERFFYHHRPAGVLYAGADVSVLPLADPRDGREVIYFFSEKKQPAFGQGKYVKHHEWLVVMDDDTVHYLLKSPPGPQERIVFTVDELKRAVQRAGEKTGWDPKLFEGAFTFQDEAAFGRHLRAADMVAVGTLTVWDGQAGAVRVDEALHGSPGKTVAFVKTGGLLHVQPGDKVVVALKNLRSGTALHSHCAAPGLYRHTDALHALARRTLAGAE